MYLLDTNVISELRKSASRRCDPGLTRWADDVDLAEQYLSVITIQELEVGVNLAERKDPAKGYHLRRWLTTRVLGHYGTRVLPVTTQIAQRSGYLHALRSRPLADALIASTAYVHGFTVVTRNVGDFKDTGVKLLNPWA